MKAIIQHIQVGADGAIVLPRVQVAVGTTVEVIVLVPDDEDEGLLKAAESRSQELVRRAEEETAVLRAEADGYVVETLRALRDHLNSIETDIGRSILSIEKGLATLEGEAASAEEDADYYAEEADPAEDMDEITHSMQRRVSSLAADTMGGPMFVQDEEDWSDDHEVQEEQFPQESPSRPARLFQA